MVIIRSNFHTVCSADSQPNPGSELSSFEKRDLQIFHEKCRSKKCMLHQKHSVFDAYNWELVQCRRDWIWAIMWEYTNIQNLWWSSKARIEPHGNRDQEKETFCTASGACSSLGIRNIFSTYALCIFVVTKWIQNRSFTVKWRRKWCPCRLTSRMLYIIFPLAP